MCISLNIYFKYILLYIICWSWIFNNVCTSTDQGAASENQNESQIVDRDNTDYNHETTQQYSRPVDELNESENKLPSEVQKAVCTVTAGEVKASAEAVTTKTLKGVCGSDELNSGFKSLETRLFNELHEIRILLQQLSLMHGFKPGAVQTDFKNTYWLTNIPTTPMPITVSTTHMSTRTPTTPVTQKETTTTPATSTIPSTSTSTTTRINNINNEIVKTSQSYNELKKTPKLKSLEPIKKFERELEISKFNNTFLVDSDFKLFTYYWKLENFTKHIKEKSSTTIESPIFSIKGKPMRIIAIFQHLQRDFLYLQLNYAKLKTNNRNNIVLDMGGLFKKITEIDEPTFKHKISILDQKNRLAKDIISQGFNSMDMGFSIPNSALLDSPYIKNDTLLIQIIFYL